MGDGAEDALSRMLDMMEFNDLYDEWDYDPEGVYIPNHQLTTQEKKEWGKRQKQQENLMLGRCRAWHRKRLIEMELKYRRKQIKEGE